MTPVITISFFTISLLIQPPLSCVAVEDATVDIISGSHNTPVAMTTLTPALVEPRKCVCPDVVVPKETGRRTTHSEKERKSSGERRELRRREGEYWLVPPFLIGASSVFVVYITVQCIYLHCYTKKTITGMTSHGAQSANAGGSSRGATEAGGAPAMLPTIIIHDDPSTSSCTQAFLPLMSYEGRPRNSTASANSDDTTDAQPFLVFPDGAGSQSGDWDSRRCSLHLVVPDGASSSHRTSVCSVGPVMENSSGAGELRAPRGSICYVPVGHAFSVPPHNGYVYPQGFLFARNTSYRQACTTASTSDCDQMPPATPVFVTPYCQGFKLGDEGVFFSVPPASQQDSNPPNTAAPADRPVTNAPAHMNTGSDAPLETTKQNGLHAENISAASSPELLPMVEIRIDDETSPLCGT